MNKFVANNFLPREIIPSGSYLIIISCKNTALIQSHNIAGFYFFACKQTFLCGFPILSINLPSTSPKRSLMLTNNLIEL